MRRTERRWVQRNEDKPHRCPECHRVATWDHKHYGPRTVLVCPGDCPVRWRVGRRFRAWSMADRHWFARVIKIHERLAAS